MSLSASLSNVGHPVAYYPRLARFFGSVNVAILFAQLHYWGQRCESDLGTYKTSEEFTEETGLSYREQVTARKHLRQAGFLIETPRRLEHRVYYRLNLEAVDAAFEAWTEAQTKAQSPNDENAFREQPKAQSGSVAKRSSGAAENAVRELRKTQLAACAKRIPLLVQRLQQRLLQIFLLRLLCSRPEVAGIRQKPTQKPSCRPHAEKPGQPTAWPLSSATASSRFAMRW